MVMCLKRGADLHMAQLMPLPLTVSCFSKIQIGFTFLLLVYPGSPRQRAIKSVCVCVRERERETDMAICVKPHTTKRSGLPVLSPGTAYQEIFTVLTTTLYKQKFLKPKFLD